MAKTLNRIKMIRDYEKFNGGEQYKLVPLEEFPAVATALASSEGYDFRLVGYTDKGLEVITPPILLLVIRSDGKAVAVTEKGERYVF